MEELQLLEELGKGQYGTVQKVYHKPTLVTMAMKVNTMISPSSYLPLVLWISKIEGKEGGEERRKSISDHA